MSFIIKRVPWTQQPPYRVDQFNLNNEFGAKCLQAIIPGFNSIHRDSTTGSNSTVQLISVGQKHKFVADLNGASTASFDTVTRNLGKWGSARVLKKTADTNDDAAMRRNDADLGVIFPDSGSFSVCVLVRPKGNGAIGNSDPRIYSKDLGFSTQDHDLMVGSVGTGNGRTRIRINGFTETVMSGQAVQNDSLNMIAGEVIHGTGTTAAVVCSHLREDGQFSRGQSSFVATGYTPRTTTGIAIGNNYNQNNSFNGDVVAIIVIDGAINGEAAFRRLFNNPWQIFAPQVRYIPVGVAAGGPSPIVLLGEESPGSVGLVSPSHLLGISGVEI